MAGRKSIHEIEAWTESKRKRSTMKDPRGVAHPLFFLAWMALLRSCTTHASHVKDWKGSELVETLSKISKETILVLEYYASWCPHCKHFEPEYERLGAFFDSNDMKKWEGSVVVSRIDCAKEREFCSGSGIKNYPTVRFGKVEDFRKIPSSYQEVPRVGSLRSPVIAETIAKGMDLHKEWEAAIQRSENFEALEIHEQRSNELNHVTGEWVAHPSDVLLATVDLFMDAVEGRRPLSREAKEALLALSNVMEGIHPEPLCRESFQLLKKSSKNKFFPPVRWRACHGVAVPEKWIRCDGFTCGAWTLFHMASVRLDDRPSAGKELLDAIVGYVKNFFPCEDCKQHFLTMADERKYNLVRTKNEAILWLWSAHNAVNVRLEKEQWPTRELCPACRSGAQNLGQDQGWNDDGVLAIMHKVYSLHEPALAPPKKVPASSTAKIVSHENFPVVEERTLAQLPKQQSLTLAFSLMFLACLTLFRIMTRTPPPGKRYHPQRLAV